MQKTFDLIKRILPVRVLKKIRPIQHGFLAYMAAVRYGFPSKQMIVVGITGTAGKSTTTRFLASILNVAGKKTGYITTVSFFDGDTDHTNEHGMSMPGRFVLQKELAQMRDNGCKYAIVECTSEGLAQNRHKGIDFDIAAITNLAEAHLDSHGGFENYKKAKGRLFTALSKSKRKAVFPQKFIFVNSEDAHKSHYLGYAADQKVEVSYDRAVNVSIPGDFNKRNALMAISIAEVLGVKDPSIQQQGLDAVNEIPGRMQEIKNNRGFRIFLDYAPEPVAMKNALEALEHISHNKIIHVFGSTGGHRDVAKRFEFGNISAGMADTIIITNDDVYDSDPEKIASDIRAGIDRADHKKVENVITILNRREAIKHAVETAQLSDIILITGKGSEQFLVLPGNQRVLWDEKSVIEESL